MAKEKVVLAYSGGLDTSIIIPWLKENYDYDVIAVCGDVGQGKETDGLEERAKKAGASKLYIEDLRDDYVKDYIFPTLKAGAVYEGKYLLGTSHARPIIAKRLVEIAHKEGAVAICHGATGKGNDQVRFELGIKALDPSLKIIAPWRIWDIKSREDAVDYAEAHNIEIPVTKKDLYSRDRNIWHISHEGMDLEDPANEPQLDSLLKLGVSPEKAPNEPKYITIGFEKGEPVSLDGKKLDPRPLVEELNKLGGAYGVGIADIVEDRLVGMKSRGVYVQFFILLFKNLNTFALTEILRHSSVSQLLSLLNLYMTVNGLHRFVNQCQLCLTLWTKLLQVKSDLSFTKAA